MPSKQRLAYLRAFHCVFMSSMAVLVPSTARAADLGLAEALALALACNPDIVVQRAQAASSRGLEMQARSQFDWVFTASTNLGREIRPVVASDLPGSGTVVWAQTRQTESGYQAGIGRQLRSGVIFDTSLSAVALQDDSPGVRPGQQNTTRLNVSLTVPLMRGRGRSNVIGQEAAAGLNALAAEYAVRDRVALTMHAVAVAYWTYSARIARERIAIDAEVRSENLLASTRQLVDKAEKPRADLVLIDADHADKVVARKTAMLGRIDARNSLGRVLGIGAAGINGLAAPQDAMPGPLSAPNLSRSQIIRLGEDALQRRADLVVLDLQIEAAGKLLATARNDLKPRLDLQLGASYGKASEGGSRFGFFGQPGRTQTGPSVSALLVFQLPVENNFAAGALVQSHAALEGLSERRRALRSTVVNSVEAALDAVVSSAERLHISTRGLAAYRQAIEHETIKQRNGFSTLIDVISVESKYVDARVSHLELELEYAVAVADLRLATGTLLPEVAPGASALDQVSVDVGVLQGLPTLNL